MEKAEKYSASQQSVCCLCEVQLTWQTKFNTERYSTQCVLNGRIFMGYKVCPTFRTHAVFIGGA